MSHILRYTHPAKVWEAALPLGSGRLGAMVFGGTKTEKIQLNEISLWSGEPYPDADRPEAYKHLPSLRRLIEDKQFKAAADLLNAEFTNQGGGFEAAYSGSYQTAGELLFTLQPTLGAVSGYTHALDLQTAADTVVYTKGGIRFESESVLPIGYYFNAKLELGSKESVLYTVVKIIRSSEGENGLIVYGCEFVGLAPVLGYIFDEYEEKIKE